MERKVEEEVGIRRKYVNPGKAKTVAWRYVT